MEVSGAAQNNLRGVDVSIGPGLTAVVGISGSGKSSLAFDTVHYEARRRFLETLSLGSPWLRMAPARVRKITGLGPAVAVEQNTLNRNPNSTLATSTGIHPFLRILFARFSQVACPQCGTPVRVLADEERVAAAAALATAKRVAVEVPLVRGVEGRHDRLLALLSERFGKRALIVDGRAWDGRALTASKPHDITVRTERIERGAKPRDVRRALEEADALGTAEVLVDGTAMVRAPICPGCGTWVPPLEPTAFREATEATDSHAINGTTLRRVLQLDVRALSEWLASLDLGPRAARLIAEMSRRLDALRAVGLDHLTLDRSMPTLSRGESQRTRIAIVLANRLEDLLHVLDEPTIGLHHSDVAKVVKVLDGLRGPVVMVEHDAAAIAHADDVIELGPSAGTDGGRLVFQGPPAAMWRADTISGKTFARTRSVVTREGSEAPEEFVWVSGASARNLTGFDCRFPISRLTAVTGPSGAGKTTLVRDVLLASIEAAGPVGCESLDGPALRAVVVDQSPLGNNPRSNPATYTKVLDRIRAIFAKATGVSASAFSFNRPEGACPDCEGMGAIEVSLRYLYPSWITCETCGGSRFKPEVLEAKLDGLSIADVLAAPVSHARELFASDSSAAKILDALLDVGLGYLALGQPSPSLSGGEAQRVRLARELARAKAGDLVVLDEPTTGLHPADLSHLVDSLDGLVRQGCTVVVVEHQPDVVACADWVVDLGPGGGPDGGRLLHDGPPKEDRPRRPRPRAKPRPRPRASTAIAVRGARANNLRGVDVDIPKGKLTVVTGVSGSGKSSLVRDVLEAEATRRLLEGLSMYERQSAREGPEAPVGSIDGLGPTLVLGPERRIHDRRATVGTASEITQLVSMLLADRSGLEPRMFSPSTHRAACLHCGGLGSLREPVLERLIADPTEPICGRAMRSPGYYPRGYLCTPGTGGHTMLTALADRHRFDPKTTPWNEMSKKAQHAFLYGDPEPMDVVYKSGQKRTAKWKGVFTELTHWDAGGFYTRGVVCKVCNGTRLRPELLEVQLDGWNRHELHTATLVALEDHLDGVRPKSEPARDAVALAKRRLAFLRGVGLGYLHLDRLSATLSAGEAQRVKLASVLGGSLVGITVLLDEPTRGMHPSEVDALSKALRELKGEGANTVVVVEHDPVIVAAADNIVEIGPGPGAGGGTLVAEGAPKSLTKGVTRTLLRGEIDFPLTRRERRKPETWMTVTGARENNLRGDDVKLPLGVLAGVCGVSGSGKSTLVVDTIGRALAPAKITTSVATERYDPGDHDDIVGAPERTIVADQRRARYGSPGASLGIIDALRAAFAASDAAIAAELTEADFARHCDKCRGGQVVENMGFLPSVSYECDVCDGTGYIPEVREFLVRGRSLADSEAMTIDELAGVWSDVDRIGRPCEMASRLGLGYLVVRQPSWSLSGGETQRLKLVGELLGRKTGPALFVLDEPTVGLHALDVERLAATLDALVEAGHSVLVVEHDPKLLACCDYLVELGPGGGPDGGRIVAAGTPEEVSAGGTASAPWLKEALG